MSVPVSVLDKEASANKADSTENLMASVTERMKAISRRQKWQDGIFHGVTFLFALFVLMVLAGILVSLIHSSIPAFKEFGFAFITTVEWDPVNDVYGAAIAIFGTLVTSFIALLIAVPVSFGIALFLTELCPVWLRRSMGTAIELLAGIPSIIFGMWGLFVLAPLFADHVQPLLESTLGQIPGLDLLFTGPMMGIGVLTAGDHDHPVHLFGHARRVRDGACGSERIGLCAGLHPLGSDETDRSALHP